MSIRLDPTRTLPNGMIEEAVSFEVEGELVRGNLIHGGQGGAGVLLLHGWSGVRSGPHNLLTTFARELAKAGIPSLRFDFRGRGESDGQGGATTLGHMGEDALAAARFLQDHGSVHTLYIMGICSGGNVGIGILDRLPAVGGLFLLSVYPFGDGDSFKRDATRTAHYLREYWRKLWLPATWRKLFRGELFYREIAKVLLGHFHKRREPRPQQAESPAPRPLPLHNLLKTKAGVQMTYGDADPDFQASLDYYKGFADEFDRPISFKTLVGANHNFYSHEWKQELADDLVRMVQAPSQSPPQR